MKECGSKAKTLLTILKYYEFGSRENITVEEGETDSGYIAWKAVRQQFHIRLCKYNNSLW
jgi:hypothetical protein